MAARTPDCHDRVHHPGLRGQCSATRTPCCNGHRQAGGFEVCEKCHRDTQRRLQIHRTGHRFRHVIDEPSPRTAWPGSVAPLTGRNPPWEGFLTRVCPDCESRLQGYREAIETRLLPRPSTSRKWQALDGRGDGDFNSCTCHWTLGIKHGSPTRCFPHRKEVLKRLINKKNKNDKWLRNTGPSPGGLIVWADNATRLRRRTDHPATAGTTRGSWRACRCGNDCNTSQNVEVWQCMACQGFKSDQDPAHSRHLPFLPIDANPRARYPLGRMRNDFTQ